jgi:hypothetical protein
LGIDGEMSATHGTQGGQDSWFLFGGGGPRFRWARVPRVLSRDERTSSPHFGFLPVSDAMFHKTEKTCIPHKLAKHSVWHFTPQTAFGPQAALAYEVGGGVDIGGHYRRWAIRVSGDMIGSHYFSTYQFSPKVSTGFVFKF